MSKKTNRLKKLEEILEEKQARDKKKKALLIAAIEPEKIPIVQQPVSPRKMPFERDGESYMKNFMQWSKDLEDKEGVWSWGVHRDWGETVWENILKPFLKDYEKKKWSEITSEKSGEKQRHFYYTLDQLKREAIDRLIELKHDDRDGIFRFRVRKGKRLYGFVLNQVFGTIWYDPTHEIYDES